MTHLREYAYPDIRKFSVRSGFIRLKAVFLTLLPIRRNIKKLNLDRVVKSRLHMSCLMLVERVIQSISCECGRIRASGFFRFLLFPRQVFVVLEK
jgi:hypothetical protein